MTTPASIDVDVVVDALRHQLSVAWSMLDVSLPDSEPLDVEELVRPRGAGGWTVHEVDGRWRAELVLPEPDGIGTPSIAWHEWHVIWWWTNVHRSLDGRPPLEHDEVPWPGPGRARASITDLHDRWQRVLDGLTAADLLRGDRSAWPYADDRPLLQTLGWVDVELMKNLGELHLLRASR
ncbi:MAG: DinB family protein [Actinomycetota bacterium]